MEQIIKRFDSPIEKSGLSRNEKGQLIVRGHFTSDRADMVGDIITREATERATKGYKKWGNIRYMHDPRPVGKVMRIGVADGLAWNEVEFRVVKSDVIQDVEEGLLSALSIGALVDMSSVETLPSGGWKINDYKLAEISLVDHPANYDATLNIKNLSTEERATLRQKGVLVMSEQEEVQVVEETPVVEPSEDTESVHVELGLSEEVSEIAEEVSEIAEEIAEIAEEIAIEEEEAEQESDEEPVVEEESPVQRGSLFDSLKALISEEFQKLAASVSAREPVVEQAQVVDSVENDGETVKQLEAKVKELQATINELNSRIVDLSTPINRGVEQEAQVSVSEVEETRESENPSDTPLKKALRKRLMAQS